MMRIFEYQTEFFPEDPVPTEWSACRVLKQTPLENPVNYLAAPWAVLMNKGKLESASKMRIGGGFTVCQHSRYYELIPLLKTIGVDTLFCPHVSEKGTDGIRLFPFPHYAVNGTAPGKIKDLFYAFVGIDSTTPGGSELRRKIFLMSHPPGTVVIERKRWHWLRENGWGDFPEEEQIRERREYRDLLSRSEFSLCPRGFGAGTVRFWESLAAGAVPVLLSDFLKLPEGVDWEQCIVRIPERDVSLVPEILSGISKPRRAEMSRNCREVYARFSGGNFVSAIRAVYRETL